MEAGIGIVRARRSIIPESRDHLGGIKVYFRVSQLQGDDEKCELYFLEGFSDRPMSDRGVALYTLEMGYIYRRGRLEGWLDWMTLQERKCQYSSSNSNYF